MIKKNIFFILLAFCFKLSKGQTAETVYNSYINFNLAKLQGQYDQALNLGEKLLPDAEKLPDKTRVVFYYSIGNLCENYNHLDEALSCYQKVIIAEPNYYVAQRAIGYLYVRQANEIGVKLNAAKKDITENRRLTALYTSAVKKALPHLEKAQACEPDDRTLTLIKLFYKNIKDEQGISNLDLRLQALSKNCLDILKEK